MVVYPCVAVGRVASSLCTSVVAVILSVPGDGVGERCTGIVEPEQPLAFLDGEAVYPAAAPVLLVHPDCIRVEVHVCAQTYLTEY